MSVIVVLIGASLLVATGFLIAYLWAVKSGQYDDKYTPSVRILFEEEKKSEIGSKKSESKNNSKNSDFLF
jgi:cbb3-type cytochrome oxidase maturation protein